MAQVSNLLDLDDQFIDTIIPEVTEEKKDDYYQSSHHHQTVKASCPTRWNSTLYMIESIIDLQREVDNALKRDGHRELFAC